jgi:hypothetical protein
MMDKSNRTASHSRISDFIAYICISLAVVATIVVSALKGVSESQFMKWYSMALLTIAVFGQFIYVSKYFWKKKPFWILYGASFIAHMIFCTWWFYLGREISGIRWLLLALVEILILVNLRNRIFGPKPTRPK